MKIRTLGSQCMIGLALLSSIARNSKTEDGQITELANQEGQPAPGNIGDARFPFIETNWAVTFRLKAPEAQSVVLGGGEGGRGTIADEPW